MRPNGACGTLHQPGMPHATGPSLASPRLRCDWSSLTPFGYPSIERRGPAHPAHDRHEHERRGAAPRWHRPAKQGSPAGKASRASVPTFREDGRWNRLEQFVENPPRDRVGDVTHLEPDRRSNDDDCQLSTCAGLNTFTWLAPPPAEFDGRLLEQGEAAARTFTGRPMPCGVLLGRRRLGLGPVLRARGVRLVVGPELEVLSQRRIGGHPPDTAGDGAFHRGHHGPFK